MTQQPDYLDVTELAGDDVSREQVERLCRRYYWAGHFCADRDVLEVACGTGQGLGYLQRKARSLVAGDTSPAILEIARRHYGDRVPLREMDAQALPFPDASLDVVILFEALYYLPDAERFFRECRRVLRPGGHLLISTANKDLFDFNPSPYSHRYYGVAELHASLGALGFDVHCYGDTPVAEAGWRQQLLRPVKRVVVASGIMPKSMAGKKLLKRLVFGGLVPMPAEVAEGMAPMLEPTPLPAGVADRGYKVILCSASVP